MRNAIDKLTDDQVVALSEFIKEKGRYWRKHFAEDILHLDDPVYDIRTKYGAAITHSLDTNEVHAEAKLVLEARAQPPSRAE